MQLTGGALKRLEALTPPGCEARIDLTITDEYPMAQAYRDHFGGRGRHALKWSPFVARLIAKRLQDACIMAADTRSMHAGDFPNCLI